jgi:hypothetical protein
MKKIDLSTKALEDLPIDPGLHKTTCALFFEWKDKSSCSITPPYTLKTQDHTLHGITYKSMYLIYMSCASEYEAAIKLLGHYPHWKKLADSRWFAPELAVWREDMARRDAAEAKQVLLSLAKEGNVTAARAVLAESKGVKPVGKPRGGKRNVDTSDSDVDELLHQADQQGK